MVAFEQVLYVIPVLALAASISYYAMVLRNQNKTRQTQFFLQFYSRLTDKAFYDEFIRVRDQKWGDYEDYVEKYGYGPTLFGLFIEGVGLLVKRGEIDVELVDDLMSSLVIGFWRSHGPVMLEMRKRRGLPQISEYTEFLYNEIMKVASKQHPELAT
jgi:hypothetical protein